jgi:hypothetical protein
MNPLLLGFLIFLAFYALIAVWFLIAAALEWQAYRRLNPKRHRP